MSLAELGLFTDFSVLTWVTFTTGFLGAALRVRLLGAGAATVIESILLGTLLLYTKNAPSGALVDSLFTVLVVDMNPSHNFHI